MSSRPNRRNYYRILHVQPDAPREVLKSSYRALMLSLDMHPDRGGDHWNAALVNEAYRVLSDPASRAEYDRGLDIARIGAGPDRSRTGAGADPGAAAAATARPDPVVARPTITCLFCGSRTTDRSVATCSNCQSPLTPAGAPDLETSGARAARRVVREGDVSVYVEWPQPTPARGRIVDLSPRGMQFATGESIERYRIIKLHGPLLDAVARVVTCRELADAAGDRSFGVGVEFYTVHFPRERGTFLSTNA